MNNQLLPIYKNFYDYHYLTCLQIVQTYQRLLRDAVILDVGSNIGLFAQAVVNTVPYKHLHLFEPSREYSQVGQQLLQDAKNITHHNLALGSTNSEIKLFKCNTGNIGWNTMLPKDPNATGDFTQDLDQEMVQQVVLDQYLTNLDQLDFVKIDVEGFEHHVLTGAFDTIAKFKPYLLIEVAWGQRHPEWSWGQQVYERLFSLGYNRVAFDPFYTVDMLFVPNR
jgi:FkbM family methyltransferase